MKKKALFFSLTIIFAILISGTVSADPSIIYVNGSSGNDTYDGESPTWNGTSGPKLTIGNATGTVLAGGTVNIADGTYTGAGNVNIGIKKSMTIQGESQTNTIIDAGNIEFTNIFNIGTGVNVTINNLMFINGHDTYGGAIRNAGSLIVTSCSFIDNIAHLGGGAIFNYDDGGLAVSGSTFTNNFVGQIEGCVGGGAIDIDSGNGVISSCTFTDNSVVNGDGGAIYTFYGTLNITDSNFTNNQAWGYGGAIYNRFGSITAHFNRFFGNSDSNGYTTMGCSDFSLNWWGTNNPTNKEIVTSSYSPWLYMTFIVDPASIHVGETSQLSVSFNYSYDGMTVTPIDPASGHLPDGCVVTFTTDLGSLGSITSTSNGVATATLNADGGSGTAHLSAELDNQTLNTNVSIDILYVNGVTGDDTYDGSSPIHTTGLIGPMQHIQTAINAAIPGGTIDVAEGTYTENLTINKPLTMITDGNTIITAANPNIPVLTVDSAGSGSIIQGFAITGAASSFGVYLASAFGCQFIDNSISGNFIGIYFQNSNTNTASGNTIQSNGWLGVCLDNSTGNTINNGNEISGNGEGIYIVNTSNGNTISGNNIHTNMDTGITILDNPNGTIISGNVAISGNGVIGVLIRNANSNTIIGNDIQDNGWAGIALDNADRTNIIGYNTISGNLEGINITNYSTGNNINGNNIHHNNNIGISIINNSTGNTITSNTAISNNGVIGVYLRNSGTNTISGNTIQTNIWVGICFDHATGNTINSSNNISGNLEGLYIVNNSNTNTIQGNNIHENMDTGIYIDGSTGNQITSNSAISSNGVIGILLRGANTNTITGNTLAGNSFAGIALDNASSNTINGANIVSGSQQGIYVTNNSTGNTVNKNNLQNNTWAGVVLDYAVNTTIYQNNFNGNPVQALAQNGTNNTFYVGTTGNYWSDWSSTDPRPIYGNEGLIDQYPSTTPF